VESVNSCGGSRTGGTRWSREILVCVFLTMDNVVEVLSFEERNIAQKSRQESVRARARKRTKRPFAFINEDAVIELTDTDDEGGASPKKRPKTVGKGEPEAGPSRIPESRPRPTTKPKSPRSTTNKRTHSLRAENSDGLSKATSLIILNNVVLPAVPDIPQRKANLPIDTPINVAQVTPEQPPPSVPPSDATNPNDIYIAQVLEIIPDVQPDHILMLIQKYLPAFGDSVVQNVLHVLFEDPAYPKVDLKGKRKRDEKKDNDQGEPNKATLIDYANKHRKNEGGQDYVDLALVSSFNLNFCLPINFFTRNNSLWTSHLFQSPMSAPFFI
jgi:E3 ubiquitin-protein ligase RNF216